MYLCQDTDEKVLSTALKTVLWHLPFFFDPFGGYFVIIKCTFAKIQVKRCFAGFETGFTAFAILFFSTCGGYFTSIRCTIDKIRKNVASSAFKSNLRPSPLFFGHFGG